MIAIEILSLLIFYVLDYAILNVLEFCHASSGIFLNLLTDFIPLTQSGGIFAVVAYIRDA